MVSGLDLYVSYAKVAKAVTYLTTPGCLFVATNTDPELRIGVECQFPGTALRCADCCYKTVLRKSAVS